MATGMAIMGFGGGALIGSPLADLLMKHFASATGVGVWQTFLVLAAGYFVFMMAGAIGYRVPPDRYAPAGWTPPETTTLSRFNVALGNAHKTPQFWLVWTVLFLNVSASIGIIGVASPMLQELFGGRLIGDASALFTNFDASQKKAAATIGAGFVGIISLFNIGGRFFWAALSDRIGRKPLYAVMTALGAILYGLAAPHFAGVSIGLFIVTFAVLASMYGGGFAAVPAYLADLFGTKYVGAIHGRLLTAWSCAGIAGPLLVAGMRDARIAEGVPRAEVYGPIYLILAAMLVVGFVANLLVRPVAAKWHMAEDTTPVAAPAETTAGHTGGASLTAILAWAAVGLPIAWGVYMAVLKAAVLLK